MTLRYLGTQQGKYFVIELSKEYIKIDFYNKPWHDLKEKVKYYEV